MIIFEANECLEISRVRPCGLTCLASGSTEVVAETKMCGPFRTALEYPN